MIDWSGLPDDNEAGRHARLVTLTRAAAHASLLRGRVFIVRPAAAAAATVEAECRSNVRVCVGPLSFSSSAQVLGIMLCEMARQRSISIGSARIGSRSGRGVLTPGALIKCPIQSSFYL